MTQVKRPFLSEKWSPKIRILAEGAQAFPLAIAGQGASTQFFVHLFDEYLSSAYGVANIVPEDGSTVVNKNKILALLKVVF